MKEQFIVNNILIPYQLQISLILKSIECLRKILYDLYNSPVLVVPKKRMKEECSPKHRLVKEKEKLNKNITRQIPDARPVCNIS